MTTSVQVQAFLRKLRSELFQNLYSSRQGVRIDVSGFCSAYFGTSTQFSSLPPMNLGHLAPRAIAKSIQLCQITSFACRTSRVARTIHSTRRHFSSHHARLAEASEGLPPSSGIAKLDHRALISVVGEDATRLLQGLVTNNMQNIMNKTGIYAAFLNAQGRILTDSFIYRIPSQQDQRDGYLIEVDQALTSNLMKYLQTHKLRSKVTLRLLPKDEFAVWTAWDEDIAHLADSSGWPSQILHMTDPRVENFSHRMLVPTQWGTEEKIQNGLPDSFRTLQLTGSDTYQTRRYLYGLAEGLPDIVPNKSLPHEYNMDHLNGIDFQKGCYVGQELTIRTQHTGVVRKRILPVQVYNSQSEPPLDLHVLQASPELDASVIPRDIKIRPLGKQRTAAGKWAIGLGNIGLAVCRLEMMTDIRVSSDEGTSFSKDSAFDLAPWEDGIGQTHDGLRIKAFVPNWLRGRLQKT